MIKSLGFGTIKTADEQTQLYITPNNIVATTTIITFSNKHTSDVSLEVYKRVQNILYRISPADFILKAKHLAQEDGQFTLNKSDGFFAVASVAGVIDYTINGIEENIQSQNTSLRTN